MSATALRQQYGQQQSAFPPSGSSRSLNALRMDPLDRMEPSQGINKDRSSMPIGTGGNERYSDEYEQPQRRQQRTSQRQNSVESLNFTSLNINGQRERRSSQPLRPSEYGKHPPPPASRDLVAASYPATLQLRSMSTQPTQRPASYDSLNSPLPNPTYPGSSDRQQEYYQEPGRYPVEGDYNDVNHPAYASTSTQPYGGYSSHGHAEENAYAGMEQNDHYYYAHQAPQADQQFYDPAFYDPHPDPYQSQAQQYDYSAPTQPLYYAAPPLPPAGHHQNNHFSDQHGQTVGYGMPPQGGYAPEYGGGGPNDPRTVSASGSTYSGSGGAHPPLNRIRTNASAKSSISASERDRSQPITKQAVDEYRNRIKSDPDPETQFNFSRFLIEAARRLAVATQQGSVDDAKSVKKYRDALLQEALKLIKRLATPGSGLGKPAYADAQFFLANCLGHGALGLAVDHEKAYNLYVQASKQNHPAATYRTAVCNELGAGTRRDAQRAVLFYRKASALGDTAGMYKLGMVLLNGLLGQQKNPREAVIWLKKAAAQADEENPHALHELGLLYEKQQEFSQNGQPVHTPVTRDEAQAREFFTQAAQLGHSPSQYKLASCYEYGSLTCPVDPRRSIAWYTRAAEKGHAESELALSGWYLTGSEGVLKQSDSEAYLWARRAANKGLSKAEYAVGYYSEIGIGVKGDVDEAKMWYLRAAASGNRRAMQRLSELKKLGNKKTGASARPTRQQAKDECVIC